MKRVIDTTSGKFERNRAQRFVCVHGNPLFDCFCERCAIETDMDDASGALERARIAVLRIRLAQVEQRVFVIQKFGRLVLGGERPLISPIIIHRSQP